MEQLEGEQLHELNHLIVDRLRLLHRANDLMAMKDFQMLDRVWFEYHGEQVKGTIMRLNQKTISVQLDTGEQWKVSPHLLYKISGKNPLKGLM
jgi:hypothetical protein